MSYRDDIRSGRLRKEDETFVNEADLLERGINSFNEQKVTRRFPQLTLNAGLPLSERRDYLGNSVNGGDVTQLNGEYRVRATTTSGSIGSLISRQRANYVSGGVLEGGLGVRLPDRPTGDAHIDWGFIDYDGNNGLYFSEKSDDIYLRMVNGGSVDVDVPQDQWNVDSLDGNGPSGVKLDTSVGYVYQIPFVYYGYGDITFEVMVDIRGVKRTIPIHRISKNHQISFEKPNLPLAVEVYSGTSGQRLDAYVGGRQISSSLPDVGVDRTVGARRLSRSIGTDFRPLVSFQHKTGFEDIFLTFTGMNIITDTDAIVEIQRNATLSSPSFTYSGNYEETERATQWDVSAGDTFTNGQTMYEAMVVGGTGGQTAEFNADVPQRPISEFDTITLAARTISGTGTMSASFKVNERW